MAPCKICKIDKLSNEFPPTTVSNECHHPPLVCLRCVIDSCQKHQKCPQPGCNVTVQMSSPSIQWFKAILHEMFKEYETEYTPSVPATSSGIPVLNVTVLNGDAARIPYRPSMSIHDVKRDIEKQLNIPINKQKLLYKDKEVMMYRDDGHQLTLSETGIPQNATLYLVVLLYAIPDAFDHVVFDLHWGYPSSKRDYLDASCLTFQNSNLVKIIDYDYNRMTGINHSGDRLDDRRRIGHHTIHVHLKKLPSHITHLFFTLSAWNSPNIARYPNPSLKFYEASDVNKDLCKTTFQHARNSQAVVMCSVSKNPAGQWEIYESGKLSAGNAKRYGALITTIKGLIQQGY